MPPVFDHEKLTVYKKALESITWTDDLLRDIPKSVAAHDQLDRASTSMPLNIAEGNGKFTTRDRCRYFDSARGSALECAACLDVVVAKRCKSDEEINLGKSILREVVSMLVGLIKSNSDDRVFEDEVRYGASETGLV